MGAPVARRCSSSHCCVSVRTRVDNGLRRDGEGRGGRPRGLTVLIARVRAKRAPKRARYDLADAGLRDAHAAPDLAKLPVFKKAQAKNQALPARQAREERLDVHPRVGIAHGIAHGRGELERTTTGVVDAPGGQSGAPRCARRMHAVEVAADRSHPILQRAVDPHVEELETTALEQSSHLKSCRALGVVNEKGDSVVARELPRRAPGSPQGVFRRHRVAA